MTILPFNEEIVSHYIGSDNIYHRFVSVMKQSTQKYYNMRIILGYEIGARNCTQAMLNN
jgi:hypothetical protein